MERAVQLCSLVSFIIQGRFLSRAKQQLSAHNGSDTYLVSIKRHVPSILPYNIYFTKKKRKGFNKLKIWGFMKLPWCLFGMEHTTCVCAGLVFKNQHHSRVYIGRLHLELMKNTHNRTIRWSNQTRTTQLLEKSTETWLIWGFLSIKYVDTGTKCRCVHFTNTLLEHRQMHRYAWTHYRI